MPPQEKRPEVGSAGEPDIDDPENWTDGDTAPVPARVFQKGRLGIDEALSSRIKSRLVPRIRPHLVDYVVPIGRRALEVAIREAVSQKELNPHRNEWEPEWSRIADASKEAAAALAKLLRAIDPSGKDAEHFAPFIRQSRAGEIEASKAGYRDAAKRALRDARSLVEAKQIIDKLSADTLRRKDALMALYPPSSPDHQKRAFVRVLAEAWIFLTEKTPGKNPDPLKNPFLRVVEAAWMDWHQEDSSDAAAFAEALNAAISSIDAAQLQRLRDVGPGWLPGWMVSRKDMT